MGIETIAGLHEELAKNRLLEPAQLSEMSRHPSRGSDPRALARELIQRGWLTPYQVNQMFLGHGRDLVLGHYILLERLGEGGMGQVFKARHATLGRVVALKVIRKDKLTDPEAVGRFRREIKAVSQLSHPNVVAAFDADQVDDAHFLIMEYVEGIDLGRLVREQGPLPIPLACEYIRQAACGLAHAHDKGLVHRDVKPSNLLVSGRVVSGQPTTHHSTTHQVKILDMGLARLHTPQGEEPSALTQMGVVVGTPDYMSPEQARNASRADIRSDLYSLGCTFYFLLTGKVPFHGDTATEKLIKHCFEQAPPIEKLRPDVPPRVCKIVERLMAKDPEARYPTPAKLVVALSRPGLLSRPMSKPLTKFLFGLLRKDPPIRADAPERLRKVAQRRRWLRMYIGGGAILLLLLFGFTLLLWLGRTTAPVGSATPTSRFDRVPADQLDPKTIPADERTFWQPKEQVALLGKNRGRPWGPVTALAVSPDGKLVASGASYGVVHLWDTSTFIEVAIIREDISTGVTSLAFATDGKTLAFGSHDGNIYLWDPNRAKPQRKAVLKGHRNSVLALAFSRDGAILASGSSDDTLRLWDLSRTDKQETAAVKADDDAVLAIDFAPDGKSLVSGGRDRKVRLWDLNQGKLTERWAVAAHPDAVTTVAFMADGERVASSCHGRFIRLWDATDGKQLGVTEAARGPNASGIFSADGQMFAATAGPSWPVHVWDLSSGEPRDRFNLGSPSQGTGLFAFGPANKTLVGAGNHRLQLWDFALAKPRLLGGGRDDLVDARAVALAGDGRMLATGGNNGRIRLWDLGSAEPTERAVIDAHSRTVADVKFSPDGKVLASAGHDSTLRIWETTAPKPREIAKFTDFANSVLAVAFTADGKRLAAGSFDRTIRLFDVAPGKVTPHGETLVNPDHVVALAIEPAGLTLACLLGDNLRGHTLRLWDLTSTKPRLRADIRSAKGVFSALAIAADGRTVAVGTGTGTVRLVELGSGEPRERGECSIPAARGPVHALVFAPDGQSLAASVANRLVIWDLAAMKVTRQWDLPGAVEDLAFTPEGRHLVTANGNGTVSILRLAPPR